MPILQDSIWPLITHKNPAPFFTDGIYVCFYHYWVDFYTEKGIRTPLNINKKNMQNFEHKKETNLNRIIWILLIETVVVTSSIYFFRNLLFKERIGLLIVIIFVVNIVWLLIENYLFFSNKQIVKRILALQADKKRVCDMIKQKLNYISNNDGTPNTSTTALRFWRKLPEFTGIGEMSTVINQLNVRIVKLDREYLYLETEKAFFADTKSNILIFCLKSKKQSILV